MRYAVTLTLAAVVAAGSVVAFAPPSAPLRRVSVSSRAAATLDMAYIPDGLSPTEWKKIQAEEKKKLASLGKVGPQRFKSRSFQAWQESGQGHLFPVDPKKVKTGEVPMDKVPYMQRGGAWDDSDLTAKGAEAMAKRKDKMVRTDVTSKKIVAKKWTKTDEAYAKGGFAKEQSVSIFGGTPLPWVVNSKTPGIDMGGNKRQISEQKKVTRPGTNRPMSATIKARLEKEAADERKRQDMLKAQLKSEKKGLFGLW